MKTLRIEEVGDIHSTYNYLEVFAEDETTPFLEVGVTEAQELCFTLYPASAQRRLTADQWHRIFLEAQAFLPQALANEAAYRQHFPQGPTPQSPDGNPAASEQPQ